VCSPVYELSEDLCERGMVQFGAVTCWQNSFHHFHLICENLKKHGFSDSQYPILDYYDEACETFGVNDKGTEYCGGPHPWFSPTAYNFRDIFGLLDPRYTRGTAAEDAKRTKDLFLWNSHLHTTVPVPYIPVDHVRTVPVYLDSYEIKYRTYRAAYRLLQVLHPTRDY
jgi:hypothetical protein